MAVTYMLPINEPVIVYRPNGGLGWGGGGGVWMIFNDMVFRGERKTENGHQSSPTECKRGDYTKVTAINCQ